MFTDSRTDICVCMCERVRASVRVTHRRGNSSLNVGTRISDNGLETVGNGTEKISQVGKAKGLPLPG